MGHANIVPLGAVLVVMVGPSGGGKSTLAEKHFEQREIVSSDSIRDWLLGDFRRQDGRQAVFDEFERRLKVRLECGLRAVADATNIRDAERRGVAWIAEEMGLPIVYMIANRSMGAKYSSAGWRDEVRIDGTPLIEAHETTFLANERKILAGDSLADVVIDSRRDEFTVIKPLSRLKADGSDALAGIADRGYEGITVVPDLHGNLEGFWKALAHARKKKHFVIFLGDVVDYGRDSLETAEAVYNEVRYGRGACIFGNHEKKILKVIHRERVGDFSTSLSPGNEVTLNRLKAAPEEQRRGWENRFIGFCHLCPHHIRLGDFLFVHGAATPYMFDETQFRYPDHSQAEAFAMYGETTGEVVNGYPQRIYNWVDQIPPRMTVVVGHDVRSTDAPVHMLGAAGGKAIFLDTGSSKGHLHAGGHLGWMDLQIERSKKKPIRLVDATFHRE